MILKSAWSPVEKALKSAAVLIPAMIFVKWMSVVTEERIDHKTVLEVHVKG